MKEQSSPFSMEKVFRSSSLNSLFKKNMMALGWCKQAAMESETTWTSSLAPRLSTEISGYKTWQISFMNIKWPSLRKRDPSSTFGLGSSIIRHFHVVAHLELFGFYQTLVIGYEESWNYGKMSFNLEMTRTLRQFIHDQSKRVYVPTHSTWW